MGWDRGWCKKGLAPSPAGVWGYSTIPELFSFFNFLVKSVIMMRLGKKILFTMTFVYFESVLRKRSTLRPVTDCWRGQRNRLHRTSNIGGSNLHKWVLPDLPYFMEAPVFHPSLPSAGKKTGILIMNTSALGYLCYTNTQLQWTGHWHTQYNASNWLA